MGFLKKLKKLLTVNDDERRSSSELKDAGDSPSKRGGADKLPAIKQASPRTHQSSDLAATSGGGGTSGAGISRQQTGGSKAIPTTPGAGHRETVSRSSTRTNLEPQPPQPAAPGSPRRPGSALAAAVGAAGQGFNAATTAYSPASAQHLRAGSRPSMDEGGPGAYKSSVSGPLRTDGPPSGRNSVAPPLSGRNSHAGNPSAHAAHRDSNSSLSSIVSQNAKLKNMVFVEAPATIEIESGAEPMVLPRRTPMTSMATGPSSPPAVSPSGQGPAPAPPPGAGAPGAAQQDPRNMDPKVYRRVQRIRSLPMLIDTNPLHHAALHQAAQQRQQQPRALPHGQAIPSSIPSTGLSEHGEPHSPLQTGMLPPGDELAALEAAAHASAQGQQQQPARKRAPRRHESLKSLLKLESYDFVPDVDVANAQEEVDSAENNIVDTSAVSFLQQVHDDKDDPLASVLRAASTNSQIPELKYKESNILAVNKALPRGMRRSMWSVKDYTLSKRLHQGYASDVYFARCNTTKELVVLKVYRLADQCDLQRVQLYREIRVHSRLQHQNIVQFYAAFLEDNCVVIVQEYAAGGDLLRYMYKYGGRLTERQAVNLVLQPFLAALLYLHTQGIIHRDIKPENCLLTEARLLKLADFGLAVDLNEERANTRAGTLDYMAPEVLRCPTKQTPDQFKSTPGAAHYQMGADAWAVGVFAYELIAGAPPFKGDQMIDTARNIISVNITYPATISDMAKDFIASCLRKHPGDRPTVLEMLHHPWIQMFQRRASVRVPAPASYMHRSSASGQDPNLAGSPLNPQMLRAHQQAYQQQAMQHQQAYQQQARGFREV